MAIDKTDLLVKAQELRKELGEDDESPIDIFALVLAIKTLTLVRFPMSDHFSGMCIKSDKGNLIAVNSKMTMGRQRFSLAHELYHLYFDDNMTALCYGAIGTGTDIERSADQFASYLLVPAMSLKANVSEIKKGRSGHKLTTDDVVFLEQKYGMSRQAMLVRLIDDKHLLYDDTTSMRTNVINSATNLGYSDELYRPLPEDKQFGTYGHLIRQVSKALSEELISYGKYEEILLQAYRPDIVYGGSNGGEVLD